MSKSEKWRIAPVKFDFRLWKEKMVREAITLSFSARCWKVMYCDDIPLTLRRLPGGRIRVSNR